MSERQGTTDELETEGDEQRFVTLGRVSAAHGIRGWLKIHSETDPRENIVSYSPWYLKTEEGTRQVVVTQGRPQGKAVVAKLEGCDDRDQAEALIGAEIAVRRSQLPPTEAPGEYYWADLVGSQVVTVDGVDLGTLERLFETGSNDVMVVRGERERLVPYIWQQVVHDVDLGERVIRVDWDPEF